MVVDVIVDWSWFRWGCGIFFHLILSLLLSLLLFSCLSSVLCPPCHIPVNLVVLWFSVVFSRQVCSLDSWFQYVLSDSKFFICCGFCFQSCNLLFLAMSSSPDFFPYITLWRNCTCVQISPMWCCGVTSIEYWLCPGMMPGMPGTQQVAQMRQARPAGMQQQVRAASMTARPITGQPAVAVPPQRAPGISLHSSHLSLVCTFINNNTSTPRIITVIFQRRLMQYYYSTCSVVSGLLQRRAGRSSSFNAGTVQASPACHAAACTVLDLKPRDRVTPALRELHRLPAAERIQYKLCMLVHKSLLGHTPEYISDLLTSIANIPGRSTLLASSCGNLIVPRTSRRIGDRAFSIAATRAWNRLPTELKLLRLTFIELGALCTKPLEPD